MLKGAHTAIITPFNRDESVDFAKLNAMIEIQIENGIDGIVPVGTTGESPTLTTGEHLKVIEQTVQTAAGRVKVIAGTGANSTAEAIELTRQAKAFGIDATLQVTPYYNKPNQEGLYRHFSAVADLGVPVVLYNVPGRSACEIEIDTVARLASHPYIVAVKEAGGKVERVRQTLDACSIEVLSGDDGLALAMMRDGAVGLISVAANLVPRVLADLVHAALDQRWDDAQALNDRYAPLFEAMFFDTNPIPVKAAMSMSGLIEEVYRLPLCTMDTESRARLTGVLSRLGLAGA